jgi:hypothetical protein
MLRQLGAQFLTLNTPHSDKERRILHVAGQIEGDGLMDTGFTLPNPGAGPHKCPYLISFDADTGAVLRGSRIECSATELRPWALTQVGDIVYMGGWLITNGSSTTITTADGVASFSGPCAFLTVAAIRRCPFLIAVSCMAIG